jgi:hypothetical protein
VTSTFSNKNKATPMNPSTTIASATQLAGAVIMVLKSLPSHGTTCGVLANTMATLLEHVRLLDSVMNCTLDDSQLDSTLQRMMALLVSIKKFVLYAAESIHEGMEDGLDVRFHAFVAKVGVVIEEITTTRERIQEQNEDQRETQSDAPEGQFVEHPALEDIYDYRSLISQGAFGAIYRMEDTNDGHIYAVKRVRLSSLTGRGVGHVALAQECAELTALSHHHIARHLTAFPSKGDRFFNVVMELIEGCTLAEKITSDIVPTEVETFEWTKQLASALHYMHGKNVLHSHLTPENVMLTAAGEVKIVGLKPQSLIDVGAVQCGVYTSYELAV